MQCNEIVLAEILESVQERRPLVHQITNYVSAQLQADIVAITGGCSIMSGLAAEISEITARSSALLINIGTPDLDFIKTCRPAMDAAKRANVPVTLDLVGYGFTKFRTELVDTLLNEYQFSIIKGNSAEVSALAGDGGKPKGVSAMGEKANMRSIVGRLAEKYGCVAFSTGSIDTLSDGETTLCLGGGSALAASRSGIGCALGSVAALFSGVTTPFAASVAACAAFRFATGRAAERTRASASFHCAFQDELHLLPCDTPDWRDLIVR